MGVAQSVMLALRSKSGNSYTNNSHTGKQSTFYVSIRRYNSLHFVSQAALTAHIATLAGIVQVVARTGAS